jgi:DNA modification methylase
MTVQLLVGDCLETLKTVADHSIDMTLTSPPFKEEDVEGDYWALYKLWMAEIMRVTAKVVCIIHSAIKLNRLISEYPPKRIMVWGKGYSQCAWRWNPILVYQISDEYKVNKFIWCDAFGVESITGKWKVHKYQDPELLYETIIKMFKGCNSVLDPFSGSGTTAAVCVKLGIDFIGCELNPDYIELTNKRLSQVQPTLLEVIND